MDMNGKIAALLRDFAAIQKSKQSMLGQARRERLAGVPVERIINCWPIERLLEWAAERSGSKKFNPRATATGR